MPVRTIPKDEQIEFVPQGSAPSGVRQIPDDEEIQFNNLPGSRIENRQSPDLNFLNQGIARSAGTAVDIVNEGLKLLGLGSDNPFGGTKSIRSGLEAVGAAMPAEGEKPKTLGGNIAQGIGDVGGGLVLGVPAAATNIGKSIIGSIARNPVAAATAEIASGVGSGTGGFIADKVAPDSVAGRAVGEIIGGISPSTLGRLAVSGPTMMALRNLRSVIVPFTKSGAKTRAARRVQNVAGDPGQAIINIDETKGSRLRPAERAGGNLLSLEKSIREKNALLDDDFKVHLDVERERLSGEIVPEGSPETARNVIEGRRDAIFTLLEARTRQAALLADQRVRDLGPAIDEGSFSRIVKEEMKSALEDGIKQERKFWGRVPKSVVVDPSTTREQILDIYTGRGVTDDPDDIPDFLRGFLGRGVTPDGGLDGGDFIKEAQSVGELHTLQSRVLRERRAEAGKLFGTNRRKISLLDDITDSLTADINRAVGDESFDAARTYSAQLNQKLRSGSVGRVLGFDRGGGGRVPEEATLRSTIGQSGVSGEAGMRELLAAVGESPEARGKIGQFLTQRFRESHIKDGLVTPNARKFLDQNSGLLKEFPDVRGDIEGAIDASILARSREKVGQSRIKRLESRASDTKRFLQTQVGKEADSIFNAQNPAATARNLVRGFRGKNSDPEGLEGLRAAMIQGVLKRIRTPAASVDGLDTISSSKLAVLLRDPGTKRALTTVLGSQKANRFVEIQRELRRIENAESAKSLGRVITDRPNSFLRMIARVGGAQFGRVVASKTGGGTVQTPSIFSENAQVAVASLTNDKAEALIIRALSADDPKLLRDLLSDLSPGKGKKESVRRIGAFLAGPAATVTNEEE